MKNDHQNNIEFESSKDYQIKNHDGWVARVKFQPEKFQERTQLATALHKKNVYDLQAGSPF